MSGIAGFLHPSMDLIKRQEELQNILKKMNEVQKRRGRDDEGIYLKKGCGMAHVRLAILDLETGHQPFIKRMGEREYSIVFDGEIYNKNDLKKQLKKEGATFETNTDIEVLLTGYILHGIDYLKELNGVFAGAIWDNEEEQLYLFRDRFGVKPLFYTRVGENVIFSSEIKGLFAYPNVNPVLDRDGLCEVFALGPAKTYGKGVFKNIEEVLPAHSLIVGKQGQKSVSYWTLQSVEHKDSMEQTVEKTAWLLEDAVRMQMVSDVPICTFLSGGVDSSLVTAICAKEKKKKGEVLDTFSFDFKDNNKYFQSNDFQPSQDRPWVDKMVEYARTNHQYLECDNMELMDYLYKAVDARDLPCMADVESSMLYFCSQVARTHKVALTGECADEIFGGYPWFHKQEFFEADDFPWSRSMEPRQSLLSKELIRHLPMKEYAHHAYETTIKETPLLEGENKIEKRRREIAYLNLRWFMVTLLDRMERTSMYSGMGARVPFADYRIVEYVFNVPWEMKCPDGVVKGLLRRAGEQYLPKEVLYRKKSPYPKTYHPAYERMLGRELHEVLSQADSPIRAFVDKKKVEQFLSSPSNYGKPWYGQLMAGPQMLAYLLQVNYWLKKYKVQLLDV